MRDRWICGWTASIGGLAAEPYAAGTTLREVVRVAIGGAAVRLRFTNLSPDAVALLSVTVGLRRDQSAATWGSPLRVTKDGEQRIVLPPRGSVYSDPIPLAVSDGSELLVSLYSSADAPLSTHPLTNRSQYRVPRIGEDRTHDSEARAFVYGASASSWIDAVDVFTSAAVGAMVVLGDSMSDRVGTPLGTFSGWTDVLGRRMARLASGDQRRRSVVTAGISGNTLAAVGDALVGPTGLARLDRDVLSQSGVTDVLVFEGTNDLLVGNEAAAVIESLQRVAERCRNVGIRSLVATLLPRKGGVAWTDAKSSELEDVNNWIRTTTDFGAMLDFGRVLDDGSGRLLPECDADGTHPNAAGHRRLANSIDLDLLR